MRCCCLAFGLALILSAGGCGGSRVADKVDPAMAITWAKYFVTDRLLAPSTASFPGDYHEYKVLPEGGGKWEVSGYVDARLMQSWA